MNWNEKKVLVVGCGISGIAASSLLAKRGAKVILFDENAKTNLAEIGKKLPAKVKIEVIAGNLPAEIEREVNLLVLSPGVPVDTGLAEQFRKKKIPIIGEIELAYLCGKGSVIAITGTNGKTTTTALTGKIMEEYFDSVFVVGNIGNPYTKAVERMSEDSVTVAEISSFQLETTDTFHPQICAILNITPDHLNRHHTMENYVAMKERIAVNQEEKDICVLNYEDPYCRCFGQRCPSRVIYFSSATTLDEGYYLEGEEIWFSEKGKRKRLINIHEMKLLGIHNVENVMAAIAIAAGFGVPMDKILETVRNFSGVEHRIEYVTTIDEVDYYNDSKGTNPDAAIRGIQAMNRPTVLIGGGYDKGSDYEEWIDSFEGKVTWLILLGETREKIAACARQRGFTNILLVNSLEEAVEAAKKKANAGEAVLLSPACASWGMFPNYEVRGNHFKEYVMKLKES